MSTSTLDKVRFHFSGEFTAQQLEEAIAEIAQARATMQPSVASEPEYQQASVLEQPQPQFRIRNTADGGMRIWMRSDGLGWQAFSLSAAQRKDLADFLGKQLGHSFTAH